MPRYTVILITLAVLLGIWNATRPQVTKNRQVKGIAVTKENLPQLPSLTQLPVPKQGSKEPFIAARNFAIIDLESGMLLHEKNSYQPVPIASLTKLMTAALIVEENNLQDIIEISKEATFASGSTILLRPGEKISAENLLKGLLIQSGNDAAFALAQHNAGTIEQFVAKMNQKAKSIGLRYHDFKDPAGLNDGGVASTKDIAILMAYALRHEKLKEILKIPETIITSTDGTVSHRLENSNRLVKEELFFPGIIGGKTGFTPTAGHNMVAAASRQNHTVIVVIINTHDQAKQASAIEARKGLDWAFANHVWLTTDQKTNN